MKRMMADLKKIGWIPAFAGMTKLIPSFPKSFIGNPLSAFCSLLSTFRIVSLPLVLTAAYFLFPTSFVFAASTDTISLYVTPSVTYGVSITSVNDSGYDFGLVNLNSVTHSTSAIVVQNTGDIASQWQLKAVNSGSWSAASSTGTDQFTLMAVFTSTASSSQVATSEFTNGQDEVLTNYQTSTGTTNAGKYNAGVAMDSIPPSGQANSKRNLWLKLKMPSSSSVATQQTFRIYITAVQTGQ